MKNFLKEFREFAVKGNVIDLAVGVVIGGAFSGIITSLVNDIITPTLGVVLGKINFTSLSIRVGASQIKYGNFIQAAINFIIVALVIFIAVRIINRLKRKQESVPASETAVLKREEVLLEEIRDLLAIGITAPTPSKRKSTTSSSL